MNSITIEGQLRTDRGKRSARLLRSQGLVPGVIYGGEKEINFQAPAAAFRNLVYTGDFQVAEMQLDGATYRCILKDLQFDKVSDQLIHVDLLELVDGKTVVANIPLKFVGNAAGVRAGGRLVTKMKALKVKALPKDLVENIVVDVTNLVLNGNIRVEDVKVEGLEFMNSPRIPLASVVTTRQLRQGDAAGKDGEEGEGEEGEGAEAAEGAAAEA